MSVCSLIIKHENHTKKINDCIGTWRNIKKTMSLHYYASPQQIVSMWHILRNHTQARSNKFYKYVWTFALVTQQANGTCVGAILRLRSSTVSSTPLATPHFVYVSRKQRDINRRSIPVKCLLFLSDFNQIWLSGTHFTKNPPFHET